MYRVSRHNDRAKKDSATTLLRNKLRSAMNRKRTSAKLSRNNDESVQKKRLRSTRVITPRIGDYITYVRTITSGKDRTLTSPVLPSMEEQGRIFLEMRDRDGSLFDIPGIEGRERVMEALRITFGVNHRLSVRTLSRQFVAQIERKAWRDAYFADCRLGMFDSRVPVVAHVSLDRSDNGNSSMTENYFSRACRTLKLKPVRLEAAAILFAKQTVPADDDPPVDSLISNDLRRLGVRSLYFQRIYMLQILVYLLACEGVTIATKTTPGNKLILIIDRRLESMLRLPTSISVLLHGDELIAVSYQ